MHGLMTNGDDDLVKKKGATLYTWNFFGVKKITIQLKIVLVAEYVESQFLLTSNLSSHYEIITQRTMRLLPKPRIKKEEAISQICR